MAGCTNILKSIKVIVLVLLFFLLQTNITEGIEITELKDDRQVTKQGARHFCYLNNIKPSWRESWTRIQVQVWSSKDLKVTVVEDEEELEKLESFSFWTFVQYFIKEQTNETHVPINLFAPKTCFKVDPSDSKTSYTVKPSRKWDVFLFGVFLTGVVLFFFADILSKSQMFYYSGGISVGMIASLLILIYIMARFLPKKSPFYVLLAGGWSLSFYVIQLAFKNMKIILREHWHLAVGYTVLVGFVSFAVCYRHGPLVNQRSIDILSWSLQLIGLLLMYAGIQVQQVALAIMVAAFCAKYMDYPINLAIAVYNKLNRRMRWKLEPRRLLTEEEYQKQAEIETSRALDELRQYCNSPEFNTWKTVSRLQSPKRFADFVEGSPHLVSNEVSVHAHEYGFDGSFLDDEMFSTDEEQTDDEEEVEGDWKKDLRNSM